MKVEAIRVMMLTVLMAIISSSALAFVTGTPVPTDSRIKTFVYNANDVYRVLTHYGYQMNIEFGDDEEIETVSVGERAGWQITPTEDRLFVRAMEDKAHTNMTVITNKRTYQFDLYSSQPGQQGWDELVYVVRFYYPENIRPNHQFAARGATMLPPARPVMASFPQPTPLMQSMPPASMLAPLPPAPPMLVAPPSLPPLAPPPPMTMAPSLQSQPMLAMPQQMPQIQQAPQIPMGQPLYSPALPPVAPPPMATPHIMNRPATPVPPVNVARKPFGMIVPPHVAVAPPPRMPHPRAPFVANQMSKDAQTLARQYPRGSYKNPRLAPRTLPSLNRLVDPRVNNTFDSSKSLPLPSSVPSDYMQF